MPARKKSVTANKRTATARKKTASNGKAVSNNRRKPAAETTERRHIDAVVTRYAMAYPNVRFSLVQDGRITFSTTGSGDLSDVLIEVLR